MKFIKSSSDRSVGPSSALGIIRFFDADSKSPQLSPYFVVAMTIVFLIIILILKRMLGL